MGPNISEKFVPGGTNFRGVQIKRDRFNASNTFVLRVEHPYIVRKSEKSLDMGELTFHAEKTACCRLQQETKVHV